MEFYCACWWDGDEKAVGKITFFPFRFGTKRKTVARNIDYGEFRFLLHEFDLASAVARGGKGGLVENREERRESRREDIIKRPPQIMFINTLSAFLNDSSLRAFTGGWGERQRRMNAKIHKFSTQSFLFVSMSMGLRPNNEMMKNCVEVESSRVFTFNWYLTFFSVFV